MKINLFPLLILGLASSAHASIPDGDIIKTERTLVFSLTPKDAVKCGAKIITDILNNASVEKVIHTTEKGIYSYYEITDRASYSELCTENTVQKLTGYFDLIRSSVKLKNTHRVFRSTRNILSCSLEGEQQLGPSVAGGSKFFVVKKTFGQKELTPYYSNEIAYEIYNDVNVKIASCDKLDVAINVISEDLTYSNEDEFNKKLLEIKTIRKGSYDYNHEYRIGKCMIKYEYDPYKKLFYIHDFNFMNRNTKMASAELASEAEYYAFLDKHITPAKCMIK